MLRRPSARAVHTLLLFALALVWSGTLASRHLDGRESLLDRLEFPLLDLRYLIVGPKPAPDAVAIVALDDEAAREAGAYPLPRATLAKLVRAIASQEPRAIGLDVLLLDRTQDEADAVLEATLRETGTVIAGAAVFSKTQGGPTPAAASGLPLAERMLEPLARFREAAAFGLVNVASDDNGTPRQIPLLIAAPEGLQPALSLRVAAKATRAEPVLGADGVSLGAVRSRLDLGVSLPLRFYGPRGSIPTASAASLLQGRSEVPLRGRIVLVGATLLGAGDTFATPYDPVLPGVEVLATGAAHLVAGDGLVRDTAVRRIDAAAAIGFAVAAAALLAFTPPALAAALIGLAAIAWLAGTIAAFASQIWLAATLPLAALLPVVVFGLGGRLLLDRRAARALAVSERALRAFHPPQIAARIARDPLFLAEPMAQEAAILFLDLSGFTGMSERLGPEATQAFLKRFHARVEACVSRHGGLVATFMGDGAMCVFGLADPDPEDARHALACALDLVPEMRAWLDDAADPDGPDGLRVGVHYGPVVVSRLGSAQHQHITATGDSVNLASRLMEVGKGFGAALVVSDSLIEAAGPAAADAARFEGRRTVTIRGRAEPIGVAYRWLLARAATAAPEPAARA